MDWKARIYYGYSGRTYRIKVFSFYLTIERQPNGSNECYALADWRVWCDNEWDHDEIEKLIEHYEEIQSDYSYGVKHHER
jgi:hypothetical protein